MYCIEDCNVGWLASLPRSQRTNIRTIASALRNVNIVYWWDWWQTKDSIQNLIYGAGRIFFGKKTVQNHVCLECSNTYLPSITSCLLGPPLSGFRKTEGGELTGSLHTQESSWDKGASLQDPTSLSWHAALHSHQFQTLCFSSAIPFWVCRNWSVSSLCKQSSRSGQEDAWRRSDPSVECVLVRVCRNPVLRTQFSKTDRVV